MPEIRFDDRVAVITGGGSGLGRSYALALSKKGAKVVVNDLGCACDGSEKHSEPADLVVSEIKNAGGQAIASYDTVATAQGGENIIKTAMDNFGKVDILINNAGIIQDKSLVKMTEAEWDQVIAVHLKGAFCVIKPAFEMMKLNNYGRIVNVSSGAGLYGNFGQANYCAAKMGLVGLMNSVSIEGAKYDIKCNTISPMAGTRLTEDYLPANLFDKLKPEFITPLVLFLCSDQNKDTKMIFNCAGGWYSRTEILCAPGITLGDGSREIPVEEIHEQWENIKSLENAKPLGNVSDSYVFLGGLL